MKKFPIKVSQLIINKFSKNYKLIIKQEIEKIILNNSFELSGNKKSAANSLINRSQTDYNSYITKFFKNQIII